MSRLSRVPQALLVSLLFAVIAGCTAAPQVSNELPDWVRVVVPERDGRSLFVGGAAFAVDPQTGVEEAMGDARSQIHLEATKRFTDLFGRGLRESGVETTSMERVGIKNSITGAFGDRMSEAARRDTVYYRPCGDAGAEAGAGVCQIFVLMSVDASLWNRELGELLAVEESRRSAEGEEQAARFVEWLMREVLDKQPEEARERSR